MLVFNKNLERVPDLNFPLQILASSSQGNAVYLQPQRLLFDIGLPFNRLGVDLLLQLDYILLTHEHKDHLNLSALKRVLRVYPNIQAICSHPLYDWLKNQEQILNTQQIKPLEFYTPIKLSTRDKIELTLTLYPTRHGEITNTAYHILDEHFNTAVLYATDLERTKELPVLQPINLMLLEANYNVTELQIYLEDLENQASQAWFEEKTDLDKTLKHKRIRTLNNLRHLSEEEAIRYVQQQLSPQGYFIPLHASKTFGNYIQPNTLI